MSEVTRAGRAAYADPATPCSYWSPTRARLRADIDADPLLHRSGGGSVVARPGKSGGPEKSGLVEDRKAAYENLRAMGGARAR